MFKQRPYEAVSQPDMPFVPALLILIDVKHIGVFITHLGKMKR